MMHVLLLPGSNGRGVFSVIFMNENSTWFLNIVQESCGICDNLNFTSQKMDAIRNLLPLVISIAVPLLACSLSTRPIEEYTSNWYTRLSHPGPKLETFSSIWLFIYVMMGYASYLIWLEGGSEIQLFALSFYLLQLYLNLSWSRLFFETHQLELSLSALLSSCIVMLACIWLFYPIAAVAAYLMSLSLLWVAYVAYFNWQCLDSKPNSVRKIPVEEVVSKEEEAQAILTGEKPKVE